MRLRSSLVTLLLIPVTLLTLDLIAPIPADAATGSTLATSADATTVPTDNSFAATLKRIQAGDPTVLTLNTLPDATFVIVNGASPTLYDPQTGAALTDQLASSQLYQTESYALDLNSGKFYLYKAKTLLNNITYPESYFEFNPKTMVISALDQNYRDQTPVTDPITFTLKFIDAKTNSSIRSDESVNSGLDDNIAGPVKDNPPFGTTLRTKLQQARGIAIPGYTFKATLPADPDQPNTFVYTYDKNPDTSSSSSSSNTTSTMPSTSTSSSESTSSTKPTPAVPITRIAVYATKKIGLYNSPNFSKATRKFWYAKQVRTKRPQFVVIGYARNKAGILRYKVRDANRKSKTFKQRGYITTNTADVSNTYYLKNPKTVRIIGAKGVNAYTHINLNGKVRRHFKHGSVLKVKALKTYHLTTRLLLTNGQYVTANKTLVQKK